jgi:hypothetical protein
MFYYFIFAYYLSLPCCPTVSDEEFLQQTNYLFIGKIKTIQVVYNTMWMNVDEPLDDNFSFYTLGSPISLDTNLVLQYHQNAKQINYLFTDDIPTEYVLMFEVLWSFVGDAKTQAKDKFYHQDHTTISIKSINANSIDFDQLYLIHPTRMMDLELKNEEKMFFLSRCSLSSKTSMEKLENIANYYKYKPLKKKRLYKRLKLNKIIK